MNHGDDRFPSGVDLKSLTTMSENLAAMLDDRLGTINLPGFEYDPNRNRLVGTIQGIGQLLDKQPAWRTDPRKDRPISLLTDIPRLPPVIDWPKSVAQALHALRVNLRSAQAWLGLSLLRGQPCLRKGNDDWGEVGPEPFSERTVKAIHEAATLIRAAIKTTKAHPFLTHATTSNEARDKWLYDQCNKLVSTEA